MLKLNKISQTYQSQTLIVQATRGKSRSVMSGTSDRSECRMTIFYVVLFVGCLILLPTYGKHTHPHFASYISHESILVKSDYQMHERKPLQLQLAVLRHSSLEIQKVLMLLQPTPHRRWTMKASSS